MSEVSYKFALEADNLLQNNEFTQAIALCEAGLLKYPNYPLAMALLAKAYYLSDEIDSAKIIIAAAEKRYPINLSIINAKRQIYSGAPEIKNDNVEEDVEIKQNIDIEVSENISTHKDKYDVLSQLEELKTLTNILKSPLDDESFINLSIDEEIQNDIEDAADLSFNEDAISDVSFSEENLVETEEDGGALDVSTSEFTGEEVSVPDVATEVFSSSDDIEATEDLSFNEDAISDVSLEDDDGAPDVSSSEFAGEEFSTPDVATELASSSDDIEETESLSLDDVSTSEFPDEEVSDTDVSAEIFSDSDLLADDISDNSFVSLDEIVEAEEQIGQEQNDIFTEECDLENECDTLTSDLAETEEEDGALDVSTSEFSDEEVSASDVATELASSSDDVVVPEDVGVLDVSSSFADVEEPEDLSFEDTVPSDISFSEEDLVVSEEEDVGAPDVSSSEFSEEEFSASDVATELASSSADVEEPEDFSFEDTVPSDISFSEEDLVVSEEEDSAPDVSSSEFPEEEVSDNNVSAEILSDSDLLADDISDNSFVSLDEIVEAEEQIGQEQNDIFTEECDLENEYDTLASDLTETEDDVNKFGLKSIAVDESSSKGFSFPYEEIKEEVLDMKNANFLYKIDLNYRQDNYLLVEKNFNVDPDEHIFTSVDIDNVDFLLEENLEDKTTEKFNIDNLSQIAKQVETAKITPVTETVEEEDDNFEVIVASETMAKIFVKQKAYKKAIKVYEMLISEKPDKKEYFAQQIKELEEKL